MGKQTIDGHDNPRNIAYIDADGTDLQVIAGVDARHPRLRPRPWQPDAATRTHLRAADRPPHVNLVVIEWDPLGLEQSLPCMTEITVQDASGAESVVRVAAAGDETAFARLIAAHSGASRRSLITALLGGVAAAASSPASSPT